MIDIYRGRGSPSVTHKSCKYHRPSVIQVKLGRHASSSGIEDGDLVPSRVNATPNHTAGAGRDLVSYVALFVAGPACAWIHRESCPAGHVRKAKDMTTTGGGDTHGEARGKGEHTEQRTKAMCHTKASSPIRPRTPSSRSRSRSPRLPRPFAHF